MKKGRYIFIIIGLSLSFILQSYKSNAGSIVITEPGVFDSVSKGTYPQRRQAFLEYAALHGKGGDKKLQIIFPQIARIAIGMPLEKDSLKKALDIIYSNTDCNDFTMNSLLRLSYMNKTKSVLDEEMSKKVKDCILDFKYWWDDARVDTTYRCYHTENHQALYHTAELLAGQLYKDSKFTGGMTGYDHMRHAIERLTPWLEYRFRFGFSEWLSSDYYDVDIMLLTNIYDFAEDEKLKRRAGMVLDLLFMDLALNNYHGVMPVSSGRMYSRSLITGICSLSPVLKLAFGEGQYLPNVLMATTSLALSKYQIPQTLSEIAIDYKADLLSKQRVSINIEDAHDYGLSYDNELNTHLFWGMQEFIHPMVISMSKQISEKYKTYPYSNEAYARYIQRYNEQIKEYGKIVDANLDRFALSEANIETYRTNDFMLSTAIDYRKGAPGYQQHIWQATLSRFAVVFTNYPGSENPMKGSPNYWAGNEVLPRATQSENVAICIYNIPEDKRFDFTHAYFPKYYFDEVQEKNGWILGKKNDGYVALRSQEVTEWKRDQDGLDNDVIAKGRQNIWICEVGRKKEWGSFAKFVDAISSSQVSFDGLNVQYTSPSRGMMSFGWDTPFIVEGKEVALRGEYRYNNIYSKTKFNSMNVSIKRNRKILSLDYSK